MKNKYKIYMIVGICLLCISIVGSTIAYYVRELFNIDNANTITYGLDYYINYAKGQNIEGVTLEPSTSYEGSYSSDIEFWKTDDTYTIFGHLYMDVNSLGESLSDSGALKYTVVYHGNIISEGSITNNGEGTILMAANIPLETSKRLFTVYIWLDDSLVPGSSINNEALSLSVRCEATMKAIDYVYEGITPITDFTYYLGNEHPIVDFSFVEDIEYEDEPVYNKVEEMTLAENEVMLVKYIGASSDVNVPDTYIIDGDIYNVVLVTYVVNDYECSGNEPHGGTFVRNTKVRNVTLGENVKMLYNDSHDCGNIDDDGIKGVIENDASHLFYGCTGLIDAEIPNSVTSMDSTFSGCTSLVSAPEIPSSVTSMDSTFRGCTSLVNAPEIPSSVTDIRYTFSGCSNLSGTIKINTPYLSHCGGISPSGSNIVTVLVPQGTETEEICYDRYDDVEDKRGAVNYCFEFDCDSLCGAVDGVWTDYDNCPYECMEDSACKDNVDVVAY